MHKIIQFIPCMFLIMVACSCNKNYTPEQRNYISRIEQLRESKNISFKNDDDSPFNHKSKIHFAPLKYYDIDPSFVFKSKLQEYGVKDTIKVFGTKGDQRKAVRFGFVTFNYDNMDYKMNVYKGTAKNGQEYYSIWFTDKTTGNETYGVGRYLDFEYNPDPAFIYTIDFNLAYNPYCAYSPDYSCAVPLKEDHIDISIKAGEKKFH
ncbi:MAG: DUF1684 domain-containing protein [Ignavibacteriaceae bacterium]|nr:DUF1684 domain-containing protein [Ignavibacteriaceae bacterium]